MATNYERFMNMSVIELAEIFSKLCLQMEECNNCTLDTYKCPYDNMLRHPTKVDDWAVWLEEEEQ